ncbi:MAG: hypothetical protein C0456_17435 [Hyphomonas sp.]|nr:DUF2924 domain-containing protein [Hyphomonas sp.]MBA4228398.1 hypothetical protein [Hyphomonas sp.]
MPRSSLVDQYQKLLSAPPPKGMSTPLLCRIVAYEVQSALYGGLPLRTRNKLQAIASDLAVAPAGPSLRSGSRLVRDWNGITHIVDVVKGGYRYRGRVYRSLSAIAREITGARWSGPRFFGLKGAS